MRRVTPSPSRKARSWETATIVPAKARSAASTASSVSGSRWLVGSSRSSSSAPEATIAAMCTRARSPGLRRPSGRCTAAGVQREGAEQGPRRALVERGLRAQPVDHALVGGQARPASGAARAPRPASSTVPAAGTSTPDSTSSSVVLPAPLGPVTATRSPPMQREVDARPAPASARRAAPRRAGARARGHAGADAAPGARRARAIAASPSSSRRSRPSRDLAFLATFLA